MDLSLCPGFLSPPFLDYTGYHHYIDEHLPSENPTLYGLHPNAELECLTVTSDNLLKALLELQPQNSFRGEGAAQSTEEKVCMQKESLWGREKKLLRVQGPVYITIPVYCIS